MDIKELFENLPEHLQDKIIRMNPHPITDLFDEFYLKYRTQVNKRNSPITKKQRKLWSRVYYNSELDYYSMTLQKLCSHLKDSYYYYHFSSENNSLETIDKVIEWITNNFDDDSDDDDSFTEPDYPGDDDSMASFFE